MTGALAAVVATAERDGATWRDALLPPERRDADAPWAPLCGPDFADGMEAIYEGFLLHHGQARLFAPADRDASLLCGDWLYARGLVWIAERRDVDAVAALAELIALAARGRAEADAPDDFALWAGTALHLGDRTDVDGFVAARERLRDGGDATPLEAWVGDRAPAGARAAHARLAARPA